jgi:hypothetical protein
MDVALRERTRSPVRLGLLDSKAQFLLFVDVPLQMGSMILSNQNLTREFTDEFMD